MSGERDPPKPGSDEISAVDSTGAPQPSKAHAGRAFFAAANRTTLALDRTLLGVLPGPEPGELPFDSSVHLASVSPGAGHEGDVADGSKAKSEDGVSVAQENSLHEPEALRLNYWGLRFESDATEAAYRLHHPGVAVPPRPSSEAWHCDACPPRPDWPSHAESPAGALASTDLVRVPGRGKRHPLPSTHTAPHG